MLHRVDRLAPQPHFPFPSISVLLPGAAPPSGAPAALLELAAWWEAKAARGMPARAALDPVEVGRHLAHVALLDPDGADFRFRLAGEELRARYGPLSGRSLGEVLSGDARAQALREHRACAAGQRPTLARRPSAASTTVSASPPVRRTTDSAP